MSDMEEGMIRLASALDKEDMIGFTRSFVNDIRAGREAVNRDLLPWLDELDTGWSGVDTGARPRLLTIDQIFPSGISQHRLRHDAQ